MSELSDNLKMRAGSTLDSLEGRAIYVAMTAIGWAYADCCATLDAGGDPRKTDMADVIERACVDLELSDREAPNE